VARRQRLRDGAPPIGELHEWRTRRQCCEGIADPVQARQHRLGDKRQAGDNSEAGTFNHIPERVAHRIGIAL